jgi:hypothetical protein
VRVRPTNDFAGALHDVEQVSRHYYVLAFQPADPAPRPGRPRELKVRVKREGLVVSHRAAYVVPRPPAAADAAALRRAAAESIAKGLSGGPLGMDLAAMPYRDRAGAPAVPVVLHLDGRALAGSAQGERLDVQVYGYALASGHVLDSLSFETTLDLTKVRASLASDGLRVLATFAAAPGPVDIRFFARAGPAGQSGSIRTQVEVPAAATQAVAAAWPTLPATGKVVAPVQTQRQPPLEIPFRMAGQPFLPDASAVLKPGARRDICVFAWPSGAGPAARVEVTGEIARAGEAPRPVRIEGEPRAGPDADGFARYLVTVVPPSAAPGEYVLRLALRDAGSGWTGTTETKVTLAQ